MEFHDDIRTYVVPAELNDVAWTYIDSFVAEKLSTRVERDEIGSAWTTREGKFPKRMAKYLRRKGIKAAPEIVSEIGNIASRHVAQQSTYRMDFTQSIDWRAGDFGDAGSCFWGDHSGAKDMLEENGAYAVRFYDADEDGIGRAWLAPFGEAWIAFNSYGIDLFTVARVLSHAFGWTYERVHLENNGMTTGMLYVNSGRGIAIGPAIDDLPERIDLRWEERGERCADCECSIDCDCSYSDPDGRSICEDCYCNSYSSCSYCGETFTHDDVHNCDDEYLCEHCAERQGFSKCGTCHEWHKCACRTTDDEPLCDSCSEDQYCCDECGLFAGEATEHSEAFYCAECADSLTIVCDCCHERADRSEATGEFCSLDCSIGIPQFSGEAARQMHLC